SIVLVPVFGSMIGDAHVVTARPNHSAVATWKELALRSPTASMHSGLKENLNLEVPCSIARTRTSPRLTREPGRPSPPHSPRLSRKREGASSGERGGSPCYGPAVPARIRLLSDQLVSQIAA